MEVSSSQAKKQEFFSVSNTKIIVLGILTLGFYELYWQYRNWKIVAEMDNLEIKPFWRAFFAYFYVSALFKTIAEKTDALTQSPKSYVDVWSGLWIALTFIGSISARMQSTTPATKGIANLLWLISFLSVVSIVKMQSICNRYNKHIDSSYVPQKKFFVWDIVLMLVGLALIVLSFIGIFYPS